MATSWTVSMTCGGLNRIVPLPDAPAAAAESARHDAGVTRLAAARGLSWTAVGTRHLMPCNMARRRRAAPIRASPTLEGSEASGGERRRWAERRAQAWRSST
jgi:hypothetical protein